MKIITPSIIGKSLSYPAYREFITNALENAPFVLDLDQSYLEYAILNEARVKRLDKTLSVSTQNQEVLQGLQGDFIWLVISESWCGDAAQILPMLYKLSLCNDNIDLQVVFRDQNLELMDAFLTNGARSIPKLIVVNKQTLEVEGVWGPRPKLAQDIVESYKLKHGAFDKEGSTELQLWYTKDKGKAVEQEIVDLMLCISKKE